MLQKHEDFTLTDSLIDTCLIQRLSNESISGYEKLKTGQQAKNTFLETMYVMYIKICLNTRFSQSSSV
ncbi:unnamed protein product [Acanthoscelides obtectus]|uniref:Uncharacterized protein n=1 Tax=Acanthoscelides obtectus TaxID=200917 RepID=A0A9P0P5F3_ACAOB|nr:unnamed protein product [Acanthoscelides obtectus]CAK1648012.1 hypothetical protein AOBTE_LOCUS15500 [Acanthoscelides obtectus]